VAGAPHAWGQGAAELDGFWPMEELDLAQLERAVQGLDADVRRLLPSLDLREVVAAGGARPGWGAAWSGSWPPT